MIVTPEVVFQTRVDSHPKWEALDSAKYYYDLIYTRGVGVIKDEICILMSRQGNTPGLLSQAVRRIDLLDLGVSYGRNEEYYISALVIEIVQDQGHLGHYLISQALSGSVRPLTGPLLTRSRNGTDTRYVTNPRAFFGYEYPFSFICSVMNGQLVGPDLQVQGKRTQSIDDIYPFCGDTALCFARSVPQDSEFWFKYDSLYPLQCVSGAFSGSAAACERIGKNLTPGEGAWQYINGLTAYGLQITALALKHLHEPGYNDKYFLRQRELDYCHYYKMNFQF